MENLYFEVDFEKYCKTCEHKDLDEKCNPCCECLDHIAILNQKDL